MTNRANKPSFVSLFTIRTFPSFSPLQAVFRLVIVSSVLVSGLATSTCLPPLLFIAALRHSPHAQTFEGGTSDPFFLYPSQLGLAYIDYCNAQPCVLPDAAVWDTYILFPCQGQHALLPSVPMSVAPPGSSCLGRVAQHVSLK